MLCSGCKQILAFSPPLPLTLPVLRTLRCSLLPRRGKRCEMWWLSWESCSARVGTDLAGEQCSLLALRSVSAALAVQPACRHAQHPRADPLAWQCSALPLACCWPWIMFLLMTCLQRVQGSNYICLQAVLKRQRGEEKEGKKRNRLCNLEKSMERL